MACKMPQANDVAAINSIQYYEGSIKNVTAFFNESFASSIACRAASKLLPSPLFSSPLAKLFIESKSAVPAAYESVLALDSDSEKISTASIQFKFRDVKRNNRQKTESYLKNIRPMILRQLVSRQFCAITFSRLQQEALSL